MHIELINTGTELVLGSTINTNAAWIGQQLAGMGLRVARQTIVPDGAVIAEVMEEAAKRSDVILVTGGLGPTNDDITREITARMLGVELQLDERVLEGLKAFFAERHRPMSDSNVKQAMVPEGGRVLDNPFGTAPGLYLPAGIGGRTDLNCHLFLLPGPPRELKPMVQSWVQPQLAEIAPEAGAKAFVSLKVTGIGESDLVERIEGEVEALTGDDLEMGYRLGEGDIEIRLIGKEEAIAPAAQLVRDRLGPLIFTEDQRRLEEVVIALLTDRGATVATAESCTGGLIAHRLTNVSGSSAVFGSGWVTYANAAKQRELGVTEEVLEAHGAVSEPVARAMAEGALRESGADHAVAVTGIAGPTGGSESKPVGTVFVAMASRSEPTVCRKLFFPGARDRFKLSVSQTALDLLRRRLLGQATSEC